jgi:hypothetical protein
MKGLAGEFAEILDPETPEERKQSIEQWKSEGKITSAKIRLPIKIQVWSFDSGATRFNVKVPNSIWGKVEEYVGLQNASFQIEGNGIRRYFYFGTGGFNWDGIQGFNWHTPTYFEIPIDLAIEACMECGDKNGVDYLQKTGDKGATVQIYVGLDYEHITSAIHFADGSKLANKYDWAID